MKKLRTPLSFSFLLCLMSLFFTAAGISRYIETDSGNILIHDIDAESWEGFIYGGRLFRPIEANSLNQRPAVLLIAGDIADRYTCDHIAMEFARRGFVTLSMEDFSQGVTGPKPEYETENLVDAGFSFLNTRSFTDHERIGLAAYYEGADKASDSKSYPEFAAKAFISPVKTTAEKASEDTVIYTAQWESSPVFRLDENTGIPFRSYASTHAGMLTNVNVTADLLEQFHEMLAIPNDSPLWFDADSQTAPVLIGIRFFLLILLTVICTGLSGRITDRNGRSLLKCFSGVIIPLFLFFIITEFMNFFLISVRIGTPFNYLPHLRQLREKFSPAGMAAFAAAALLLALPAGKSKRICTADIFAITGVVLCTAGLFPLFFWGRSGWELAGISHLRWFFALLTFCACLESLLLRTVPRRKHSRLCAAFVTGIMFYVMCSCLPAAQLFQESVI